MKVRSFHLKHKSSSVASCCQLDFVVFLTTPNQQSRIVRAQLQEIFTVDCKQTASVCGTLIRFTVVCPTLLFTLRNFVLLVKHSPLEDSSIVMTIGVNRPILKRLVVDAVNDWNSHHCVVTIDWSE